ncbi:Rieske 2Fe-2S domain-containing protein [Gloeocapsa sp. PCC 73106]|uniref:aromatic ring-hydroxylating dioxygenase subunit alpha n=1 Tax=Gloeocapsa sp. PCC 73106 TaxID=102232 RepID=UPI0002AC0656|nr:Rieske 2Fe-2S domain-containing protein [Gloeocapsa sp. PCC 73106]ELR98633.1 Rieske (2Fe-2S) domain-containing protein [Gloeocapsa sp. PCC 73106]
MILNTTEQLQTKAESFQWHQQWYPVAVVQYLDPTKPNKIKLLGKNLVLWQKQKGQWSCLEDFCPHRGAPLSEGRVESDGTLMCAYHGWRFNDEGQCVKIPQCKDQHIEIKHCQNPKASCVAYPLQIAQGLIWIWSEPGAQAEIESKLREPRLTPELAAKSSDMVVAPWSIRDLPYGWDFFFENVCDPAHAPVSHHGFLGNRYQDANYYDMIPTRKLSTQDGFAFQLVSDLDEPIPVSHDFQPPCLMKIDSLLPNGNKIIFILYAIPTQPGWCRHIACQILIKHNKSPFSKGLSIFALNIPAWMNHLMSSFFLHQDLVFLHYQEKELAKRGMEQWLEQVYLPNPQDKMVIAFRQWLKYRAEGNIPWQFPSDSQYLPTAEENKQKLFDVWTTHTQHCYVCQRALRRINYAKNLLKIGGVVCLILALFIDNRIMGLKLASEQLEEFNFWVYLTPTKVFLLGFISAILCFLVAYLLGKLSRLFYVYEFEHANND